MLRVPLPSGEESLLSTAKEAGGRQNRAVNWDGKIPRTPSDNEPNLSVHSLSLQFTEVIMVMTKMTAQ
jgi:hypothetical protein